MIKPLTIADAVLCPSRCNEHGARCGKERTHLGQHRCEATPCGVSTSSGDRVADALMDEWRALRDDARYYDSAAAVVRFAYRAGLLSKQKQELWLHRITTTCPGHDDEGGRNWCAFCGKMPVVEVALVCDRGCHGVRRVAKDSVDITTSGHTDVLCAHCSAPMVAQP